MFAEQKGKRTAGERPQKRSEVAQRMGRIEGISKHNTILVCQETTVSSVIIIHFETEGIYVRGG